MNSLLDPALGPPGDPAAAAITGICTDALLTVLGPGLAASVLASPGLLTRIAPWARDLARGLQYADRHGPGDPSTAAMITRLAGRPLPAALLSRLASTVDLTVVMTLGRLTDQVLGTGSGSRDPADCDAAAPWLPALQLGYRAGLALEILRLSGSGHPPGPDRDLGP